MRHAFYVYGMLDGILYDMWRPADAKASVLQFSDNHGSSPVLLVESEILVGLSRTQTLNQFFARKEHRLLSLTVLEPLHNVLWCSLSLISLDLPKPG